MPTAGAACAGGLEGLSESPTREQRVARVGETFTVPEMMGAARSLEVAMPFVSPGTVFVVCAPKAARFGAA